MDRLGFVHDGPVARLHSRLITLVHFPSPRSRSRGIPGLDRYQAWCWRDDDEKPSFRMATIVLRALMPD
jgi:hypothetical protein